jgi:ribonuclease PH
MRENNRQPDQLRPVQIEPGYILYPEGSVLISTGKTRVLCNVTVEEMVPRWMMQQKVPGGWVTAEYALLPRSTQIRTTRENAMSGSRSQEIRRLIGRSLRAAVNLEKLGSRTFTIDCDVLQADGGTRSASITGGYVALMIALRKLIDSGAVPPGIIKGQVAAVSAGVVDGEVLLDLDYSEDSRAGADVNIVMNDRGEFIEVQGTAESAPFSREALIQVLDLAGKGIAKLFEIQRRVLG